VLVQQPIWRFLGNRFVDGHVHDNAQAKETELVVVCFLCGPSVDAQVLEFKRAVAGVGPGGSGSEAQEELGTGSRRDSS
jgi:hypothetical protein